jgi:molybdenum cofactor synthesis domain-containing protein
MHMTQTLTRSAVLIPVGDEILSGHTLDTNSQFLARQLFTAGFPVRRIEVVGDHIDAIAAAVRRAANEEGVSHVIVSGGIGPTPDDRTFEAVAVALDRPLILDETALAHIQNLVRRMFDAGWVESAEVSEANLRSAMVPQGSEIIRNRRGMAPAIAMRLDDERMLLVLPGIPRELTTIVEEELLPRYFGDGSTPHVIEVRYTSVPEAEMYAPMRVLEREYPDVTVGSYPQMERHELLIRIRGNDEERVRAAAVRLRELKPDV